MVKNKKVSVIIPTFKRNDSLKKSIKSVLSQTYENFEIIVVDDNYEVQYSENVNKIIDELNDNRIIYLKAEEHINGAAARNYGFNRSSGEMICFLDDDDEFYADKLLEQVNCLSTIDKAYGATACLWNRYEKDKMVDKGVLYTEEQMHRRVLSMDVKILLPTVMFKRSELEKTKLFDVSLKRHQDVQLFLDFLSVSNIYVMDKTLVRINTDSKINKLTGEELIELKKYFFEIMYRHISIYDNKTQNEIYSKHILEIAKVYFKEKNMKKFIKYLFIAKPSFKELCIFLKEIFKKVILVLRTKIS